MSSCSCYSSRLGDVLVLSLYWMEAVRTGPVCSRRNLNYLCFFCSWGQVNPGNLAMLKTGSLGLPGLKGRPEQLDTLGPPAHLAPLASVTPPSVPTLPALLLAQGM